MRESPHWPRHFARSADAADKQSRKISLAWWGREILGSQFTTSLTVTVCVLPPPVPVIVRVYVPLGVPPLVFTVSTEEVVAGFGLNPVVEPDGNPLTEKLTGPVKPLSALIAIV